MKDQMTRHCKLAAGAGLLAAIALAAAPSSAQVLPDPDHFKCYFAQGESADVDVMLQDQFDERLDPDIEDVRVQDPVRFCNPVEKRVRGRVEQINDDRNHLTFYRFEEANPRIITGVVKIANQFGDQTLEIESANLLAVPTQKLQPGGHAPPVDLNHFKCDFADGKSPKRPRVVGLADQFQTLRHKLREPHLFCNPVKKTDATGQVFAIINRDFHLTCYRISFEKGLVTTVLINNQMHDGDRLFEVTLGHLLCVPTKKLDFKIRASG